jgi:glycosyltransferase involved in cell wall biosynthesis
VLRLALISPFFPLKGGIAHFSGLLAAAFRRQGDEVVPIPFKSLYPRWLVPSPELLVAEDARLVLYNPFTWFETIRCLNALKPDVVLVAYWTGLLAPLCFVVRRLTGIKMVVLLHNLSSHESLFFEPFMQRLLALSADGFLTLSQAVANEVSVAMPEIPQLTLFHPVYEPEAVPPSALEARQQLQLDADAPVLLFFGYVRRYKGLDTLLRAMPAILQREPTLRLVVAGHFYENVAIYRQLIDELGIASSVDIYAGYVDSDRTALLFAAADAVVLPYRSATQSGVVQLAYGHGLPVIVTPVGALPEMVRHGETGWIARDSSPEGCAAAVGEFLDSREKLPAMRSAIADFRRAFSWERFATSTSSFLHTIAARK